MPPHNAATPAPDLTGTARPARLSARKHHGTGTCLAFCCLLLTLLSPAMAETGRAPATVSHRVFGQLHLYSPDDVPKGVVLLLAGNAGWDHSMDGLARDIEQLDYLVAGIDSRAVSDPALGLAGDALDSALAELAGELEQQHRLPAHPAILVGYAAGGERVYEALRNARPAMFHAGLSLEFCPPDAPAATGTASRSLATPWFVFQRRPGCNAAAAARFVRQTGNARLTVIGSGHDSAWTQPLALLQWLDPRIPNQAQADASVSGVPLIELPAAAGTTSPRLAVMLSGDGGWAELDRSVAAELARHGIAIVGWDSLGYFWQARTPDQAGADLERVLRHYLQAWHKDEVLLIGYSLGADVLPFMADRLSPDLRDQVRLVAFLGLGKTANFEFHLTDWLGRSSGHTRPVIPQVQLLGWANRLCVYGDEETDSACPELARLGISAVRLPGDHHFNADYSGVARHLLEQADKAGQHAAAGETPAPQPLSHPPAVPQ